MTEKTAPAQKISLSVQLEKAIEYEGVKIPSLTLRELTVAENLALEKQGQTLMPMEQDVNYFALMCRVAPDCLHLLGERDWKRLRNRYWETLGNVEQPRTAFE